MNQAMNETMNETSTGTSGATGARTQDRSLIIRQDTCGLRVSSRMWSRVRVVDHRALEDALQAAQEASSNVSGRVMIATSPMLDQIESLLRRGRRNALRYAVRVRSLGLYLARRPVLESVRSIIATTNDEVQALVTELQGQWNDVVQSMKRPIAEGGLGPLWFPAWYPTTDELPGLYGLDLVTVDIATFGSESWAVEARDSLRNAFLKTLRDTVERLKGDRVRRTALRELIDFAANFASMEVVRDDELRNYIESVRGMLREDIDPRDRLLVGATVRELERVADEFGALLGTPERSFDD